MKHNTNHGSRIDSRLPAEVYLSTLTLLILTVLGITCHCCWVKEVSICCISPSQFLYPQQRLLEPGLHANTVGDFGSQFFGDAQRVTERPLFEILLVVLPILVLFPVWYMEYVWSVNICHTPWSHYVDCHCLPLHRLMFALVLFLFPHLIYGSLPYCLLWSVHFLDAWLIGELQCTDCCLSHRLFLLLLLFFSRHRWSPDISFV